jgi:protein-disulfide isomerase
MGKEGVERGRGGGAGVVKPGGGKPEAGKGGKGGSGKGAPGGGKRWFYIALTGLLIGGIAFLSYVTTRPPAQSVLAIDTSVALVPNQGHVIGSDSAPVEVVEFADFECPGCGSFATLAEPDVRSRLVNTGVIRFRFMDFPLSMHRNTRSAHLAAWCAGEQGKFWEMHDIIFQNQDRWNGEATSRPDQVLTELARQVGVTPAQYQSCVSSRKYAGQIQANFDEAVRRQIQSTPTFIIGNKRVVGGVPYDKFKAQVDEALKNASPRGNEAPGVKNPRLDVPREKSKPSR